jgi:hypothetical protein
MFKLLHVEKLLIVVHTHSENLFGILLQERLFAAPWNLQAHTKKLKNHSESYR